MGHARPSIENLEPQSEIENHMKYYVYALIDPTNDNKPFYIGMGPRDRLQAHFAAARKTDVDAADAVVVGADTESILDEAQKVKNAGEPENEKLEKINELIKQKGLSHPDIARVIARELDECSALTIESFLINCVFDDLTNNCQGHHPEMFRKKNQWTSSDKNFIHPCSDEVITRLGQFYVYVLRDPRSGDIFYIGKGKNDRLNDHLRKAQGNYVSTGNDDDHEIDCPELISRIKDIINGEYTFSDVGYIIARVNEERIAFELEALLIKFVYGSDGLKNLVRGHKSGLFRSKGDWEPRLGMDIPSICNPGKCGNQLVNLDMAIGDGLDRKLRQVVDGLNLNGWGEVNIADSGELAIETLVGDKNGDAGVNLKIMIRSQRLQCELRPRSKEQESWIVKHFEKFNSEKDKPNSLLRNDKVFYPRCFQGQRNATTDPIIARKRCQILLEIANADSYESLSKDAKTVLDGQRGTSG